MVLKPIRTTLCAIGGLIGMAAVHTAEAQSQQACDAFASNYTQTGSRQGQVIGGGFVGSLVGLGIGAIAGAPGVGAAVGFGFGAIGGGARRQRDAERMYRAAFNDCMAGRIR